MTSFKPQQEQAQTAEAQIAAILEHRFGDGLVCVPRKHPENLLALARQSGFIDNDGYLTRKGRALLARYH